ncbi:hypothetical protein RAB80_002195 [Fusarium oxysporum f. sp. vasinfectum]|nr:hypothetical protein RAB80_002195 [Fusarium oxysporum f. sp. vasinfectum]
MLSQGTVPLACRQGGLCPEHTGPVRLDGAPQVRPLPTNHKQAFLAYSS